MGTRDQVLDWAARGATEVGVALVPPPSTSQPRCLAAAGERRSEDSDCMTESSFAQQQSQTDSSADGAATPLGPRGGWPALLRLVVDLCLDSDFPVQISWGPDLLLLYNEAYIPLLG